MSLGHGASVVSDGLLFYLDAANQKSYAGTGLVATDLIGKKSMNFAAGVSYLQENNGCFYFDAAGEIGSSTGVHSGLVNSTWEAWVNLEQSTNAYNMFMGNYPPYFAMTSAGTRFFFSMIIGGAQRSISGIANKTTNTWYNPVVTVNYDGVNTTLSVYVNGSFEISSSWAGAPSYSTTLTIGEGRTTSWYPFKGKVACAKLYSRELTTAEVAQNFEALRGRYGI